MKNGPKYESQGFCGLFIFLKDYIDFYRGILCRSVETILSRCLIFIFQEKTILRSEDQP